MPQVTDSNGKWKLTQQRRIVWKLRWKNPQQIPKKIIEKTRDEYTRRKKTEQGIDRNNMSLIFQKKRKTRTVCIKLGKIESYFFYLLLFEVTHDFHTNEYVTIA